MLLLTALASRWRCGHPKILYFYFKGTVFCSFVHAPAALLQTPKHDRWFGCICMFTGGTCDPKPASKAARNARHQHQAPNLTNPTTRERDSTQRQGPAKPSLLSIIAPHEEPNLAAAQQEQLQVNSRAAVRCLVQQPKFASFTNRNLHDV